MAKKEKEANKKQNGRYFKDMKAELKKVVWPAPKQLANNTITVIAFTLSIALIVFILDVCFDAINKHGVVALQQKVTSSYSAKNNENSTESENATTENASSENSTESNTENASSESSNTENTSAENTTQNNAGNSVKAEAKTETKNENNSNVTNSEENTADANKTNTETKK